jgi:hypothetical protein
VKKKQLQLQKKQYEKLAKQNLPKRLIKMQKKQVQYNVGNFFLFDLLGHPFMTFSLLQMFRGKSLFKMCLFLHKKCKMNFDSYNSDTKLEKLFNNPNLDQIRILDESLLEQHSEESSDSVYSNYSEHVEPTSTNEDAKEKNNKTEQGVTKKMERRKTAHVLIGQRHSSFNRSSATMLYNTLGLYRDETGHKLLKKIKLEENTLRTRIFFENEKLRNLLLKNDDIQELVLETNKMKKLRDKISKSQIRNVFKKILWTSDVNICVDFSEDGHLFEVKDAFECQDLNYVRFSFMKEYQENKEEVSFMKMDDKDEEQQYHQEMKEDHVGEYKVLLINSSRASCKQFGLFNF